MTETATATNQTQAEEPRRSAISTLVSRYQTLSDPAAHPRLAFMVEYVEGLAVTVAVYILTRLVYALLLAVDRAFPKTGPDDTHWYLPINFLRSLVTVVDTVALLFIAISSAVGLFRLSSELWKSRIK